MCARVRVALRSLASPAAHSTAQRDSGDSSTPTTMLLLFMMFQPCESSPRVVPTKPAAFVTAARPEDRTITGFCPATVGQRTLAKRLLDGSGEPQLASSERCRALSTRGPLRYGTAIC
jgi:hypothetical protein